MKTKFLIALGVITLGVASPSYSYDHQGQGRLAIVNPANHQQYDTGFTPLSTLRDYLKTYRWSVIEGQYASPFFVPETTVTNLSNTILKKGK
jgi:hypothetical protein